MNDIGMNISQLSILLRILRYKIGAKLFEPESKMIHLCGEMIVPQFGIYKYIHEVGSRPEVVLYWIRYFTAIFKTEISILVKSNMLNSDNLSRIDVVIGGDFLLRETLNVKVVLLTFCAKKTIVRLSNTQ